MTEQEATARGVIRREEMPFLPQYGTSYVLYDKRDADYVYALKTRQYRFREYVGTHMEISGPVTFITDIALQMSVMNVTRIQLPGRRRGRIAS